MEEAAQAAVIDETKRKEAADRHEKLLNSLKAFIYSNKKKKNFTYLYQIKYFHSYTPAEVITFNCIQVQLQSKFNLYSSHIHT